MAGPILYSANPWYAHDLTVKYRDGKHVVWCSEHYDPTQQSGRSAASAIAPSSSPKGIFETLRWDCEKEDRHSRLIGDYRKTFRRLAKLWGADGEITKEQRDEILEVLKSPSWRIWRPILYVIPRHVITGSRLKPVPASKRAAYGPEFQIMDLQPHEFDIIEC